MPLLDRSPASRRMRASTYVISLPQQLTAFCPSSEEQLSEIGDTGSCRFTSVRSSQSAILAERPSSPQDRKYWAFHGVSYEKDPSIPILLPVGRALFNPQVGYSLCLVGVSGVPNCRGCCLSCLVGLGRFFGKAASQLRLPVSPRAARLSPEGSEQRAVRDRPMVWGSDTFA